MDEGLKTLLKLYKGRLSEDPLVSEEEIAVAKEQGYLFDYPKYETHSEAVGRIRSLVEKIDPRDISNAFLFSLSTRRLEYRSALGSYYYAKAVHEHDVMKSHNDTLAKIGGHCYYCGWTEWRSVPDEWDKLRGGFNIMNYWRYRDGGNSAGIISLKYALFDLEQFTKLPKVVPTDEDRRIFLQILSCVGKLKDTDRAGKLRDTILKAKIFKSNKDELSVLLGELGICGILAGEKHPSYDVYFANEYEVGPPTAKSYFAYPVNWWCAKDGINAEKLEEVFGDSYIYS